MTGGTLLDTTGTLRDAYEALLAKIEAALGYDDLAELTTAYQDYTDTYVGVLSGTVSADVLGATSRRFLDVIGRLVDRGDAVERLDDATADYFADFAEACDRLDGDVPDLESLVSAAAATTLLSWLQVAAQAGARTESTASADPFHFQAEEQTMTSSGTERDLSADDDGIVWQEFAVGDDGQIVQTSSASPATAQPRSANGDLGAAQPESEPESVSEPVSERAEPRRRRRSERQRHDAPTGRDPVAHVQAALRDYVAGLASSGFTVDPWALAPSERVPTTLDLERQSAEVTASYLRAANGVGSLTELYATYARLLASVSQLVEQHLAHVRRIEQLASTARNIPRRGVSADQLYRQFVAATRDAWTLVEPDDLSADDLATINETVAEAAALHQAVAGGATGWPR
jgi:hypothetical protein